MSTDNERRQIPIEVGSPYSMQMDMKREIPQDILNEADALLGPCVCEIAKGRVHPWHLSCKRCQWAVFTWKQVEMQERLTEDRIATGTVVS